MKNIFKVFLGCLIASIILTLVGCSENDDKSTQSITFSGDYAKSGFIPDMYKSKQATLKLSSTQATFTCPKDYVIPSYIKSPDFNNKLSEATCDRKGGCQAKGIFLRKPKSFFTNSVTISPNKLTEMKANSDMAVWVVCVKKDQLDNWI